MTVVDKQKKGRGSAKDFKLSEVASNIIKQAIQEEEEAKQQQTELPSESKPAKKFVHPNHIRFDGYRYHEEIEFPNKETAYCYKIMTMVPGMLNDIYNVLNPTLPKRGETAPEVPVMEHAAILQQYLDGVDGASVRSKFKDYRLDVNVISCRAMVPHLMQAYELKTFF
jgi:hypothetical protein